MEDGASSVSPFVLSLSVLGLLDSVVTSVSPAFLAWLGGDKHQNLLCNPHISIFQKVLLQTVRGGALDVLRVRKHPSSPKAPS